MISTWAEEADLRALATSIAPRHDLTPATECWSHATNQLPLEVVVPRGVWTSEEGHFEGGGVVLVDPTTTDHWLRLEWQSMMVCGGGAAHDRELEISGEIVRAHVSPSGVTSACIELYDERDRAVSQAVFVRFRDSPSATAFATSILRTARPSSGWTFSSWNPVGVGRRWTSPPIARALLGLGAVAAVVTGALVVRARRRR